MRLASSKAAGLEKRARREKKATWEKEHVCALQARRHVQQDMWRLLGKEKEHVPCSAGETPAIQSCVGLLMNPASTVGALYGSMRFRPVFNSS
jgi:hypothetical protein